MWKHLKYGQIYLVVPIIRFQETKYMIVNPISRLFAKGKLEMLLFYWQYLFQAQKSK